MENHALLLHPCHGALLGGKCEWDRQLCGPGKLPLGLGAQHEPERVRVVPRGTWAAVLYAVEEEWGEWNVSQGGGGAGSLPQVAWWGEREEWDDGNDIF